MALEKSVAIYQSALRHISENEFLLTRLWEPHILWTVVIFVNESHSAGLNIQLQPTQKFS